MVERVAPEGFDPILSINALGALCRLFPEDRERYIERARGFNNPIVDRFIEEFLPIILAHDEKVSDLKIQGSGQ
ncbi:hypothetical protein A3F00_05265 [Candidatus Daviesbacteria bacterium RIFCSPHIGHO2_12_FULL_37_11]|uniref:Uncharacterized protein n=1 Tax=Candidatus Daviesbacteria bacterium RIFCSPHIGHO2_12_FULL_37_11 TaxID=1797777 RepID=A0A1F5KAE7_9BACT|nr:MAG: hypothetical protein A2111_01695 [Candidatus Daviesbacteria bacterium GWA1_38_6]OGE17372.1 MAG: hypothetical protein A2769_00825 [Candidatus Daviesbacteria bacterium RIFCSPHIGHO2_01_FULL_37_27]OGE37788.1 MAG: hypothetical protein A3F00_05265 [Candidatus Daviesbacteria bacterium RIFCSPHIGHO2_12_FULL_37_11]